MKILYITCLLLMVTGKSFAKPSNDQLPDMSWYSFTPLEEGATPCNKDDLDKLVKLSNKNNIHLDLRVVKNDPFGNPAVVYMHGLESAYYVRNKDICNFVRDYVLQHGSFP